MKPIKLEERKLKLHRDTLRSLSSKDLGAVIGGGDGEDPNGDDQGPHWQLDLESKCFLHCKID